ncbi:MAG: hypothetical protein ACIALR_02020 [Blastopirellula sp. JB062]
MLVKLQPILFAGLTLTVVFGCGRASYMKEVAPVVGVVQLDGKPVTEGYVLFTPEVASGADPFSSGKSASGMIDSDGKFELSTYGDEDGAIIGPHTVTFFRPDPEDDDVVIKERYIPGGKSLKIEVAPEPNQFEIHLHRRGEAEIIRGS